MPAIRWKMTRSAACLLLLMALALRASADGLPLDTDGKAEGEGQVEGVLEGAAEGEGEITPACDLTEFELLDPGNGANWFFDDTSAGLDVALLAEADCPEDVDSVSFFVQQGSGTPQQIGSADSSAPFEANFDSFFAPSLGQDLIWTAKAKRLLVPSQIFSSQSVIHLVSTDSEDANDDGLPDVPFSTLDTRGDQWYTSLALDGEDAEVVTWMRAIHANDAAALSDQVTAELRSPGSTGQKLTVKFDRALIDGTQFALLTVRFAPTLASLVGATEEAEFSREPTGDLGGDAQYFALDVLVTNDNGTTFNEIATSRLQAHPIRVTLEGLELDASREYTLARHPAQLTKQDNVLQLLAKSGAWQSISTQSVDIPNGTLTGAIDAVGVFAPYYVVEEGELCPLGICVPGSIIIEILSILTLGLLNFVPGGVGGGDSPCFIATAAYGSPLAGDLDLLRAFRDDVLLHSAAGTAFTDLYYRLSPPIADLVATRPLASALVRAALLPVVLALRAPWPLLGLLMAAATLLLTLRRRRHRGRLPQ